MYMRRQLFFNDRMQPYAMTHMDLIGLLGLDTGYIR